ncbi:MAG TPA: Hsp20/alpha crystallin family protein [Patescibacteria group bacterium]|nr:Hsp20/alpha crystallin family protein [Patescibacteria group bacterium]
MAIVKWNDPFVGMMHSPFDDLFSGVWGTETHARGTGAPAMDIYTDDDKSLVAEIQAPGFAKDEIQVNVHDSVLEIKGEKQEKSEDNKGKRSYMVRESHESFYRSIQLPRVADGDHVEAHFDNGVLKVVVPFKELPKPKQVTISDGKKKT